MPPRRPWSREELLLVLHLYSRITFGQHHTSNAEVLRLAAVLDRSPGSVSMKLNNFTALDPSERARGVKGLSGASALDQRTWEEFERDPVEMAANAEALWQERVEPPVLIAEPAAPQRVEDIVLRRVRLGQSYFRRIVLANFDGRCALTGIAHPSLVNASHIVGWAEQEAHRVNPKHGTALNRLHDAAFDQKLITFDEDLRLVVGRTLRESLSREELSSGFLSYEGRPLRRAVRHELDAALLEIHRESFTILNS